MNLYYLNKSRSLFRFFFPLCPSAFSFWRKSQLFPTFLFTYALQLLVFVSRIIFFLLRYLYYLQSLCLPPMSLRLSLSLIRNVKKKTGDTRVASIRHLRNNCGFSLSLSLSISRACSYNDVGVYANCLHCT